MPSQTRFYGPQTQPTLHSLGLAKPTMRRSSASSTSSLSATGTWTDSNGLTYSTNTPSFFSIVRSVVTRPITQKYRLPRRARLDSVRMNQENRAGATPEEVCVVDGQSRGAPTRRCPCTNPFCERTRIGWEHQYDDM